MRVSASNKKIREIITMVGSGQLEPKPEFQRRLVWTNADKDRFINSIVNGYPFPEIYLCDGEVDVDTGKGTYWLVDGLQRVSTIVQYFNGDTGLNLTTVPPYTTLTEEQKKAFLGYDVAVRDLGTIERNQIIEVFKRINATKYSLNDIEINNALYNGALKIFAESVAQSSFFTGSGIFTTTDYKRMGDTKYIVTVITALLDGYSNRDDQMEAMLSRYNDVFPEQQDLQTRLTAVQELITECGFDDKSRIWRKADLFTLIIELDRAIRDKVHLSPSVLVETLQSFYDGVGTPEATELQSIYHKATIQASNDRVNRIRRGIIVGGLIRSVPEGDILREVQGFGLSD